MLRTHGQAVTEQRIALFLDGLFSEEEKLPLKGRAKLTGSFQALTAMGAAAVRGEDVTYEQFDHSSPSAHPPPLAPRKKKPLFSGWVAWVALTALAAVMACLGAFAAIYLIR